MDLYKYHTETRQMIGIKYLNQIPEVVYHEIERDIGGTQSDAINTRMSLRKNRDILSKSPATAIDSARLYKRTAWISGDFDNTLLWPEGHAVEKVIAQNPNFLCSYFSGLSLKDNPAYHTQILKADLPHLTSYVTHFEDELWRQPKFLKQIFKKFSSSPADSFYLAMHMKLERRVLDLEPAIFNYQPDPHPDGERWDDEFSYYNLIATPGFKNGDFDAELETPWNLYVACLQNIKDRVDAVEQYGFNGSSFVLGTKSELQSIRKRK